MTKSETSAFVVETWQVEKLTEMIADYNPRFITERTLSSLKTGIEEFGFLLPVVVNTKTNRIVGGHQRVKAAQSMGLKEIPVHLISAEESHEKRLNLALNKIEGKWDYPLLEEALSDLSQSDSLALSGFSEADLVEIMSGQDGEFEETFEEFAERFASKKTQDFVVFRSKRVTFSCSKVAYEALVHKLYTSVGVSDIAASIEFFKLIGLGE